MDMTGLVGVQLFTTTDAVLGVSGRPCRVFSICLISGGTASTVILRDGTTVGGTPMMQIDGTISKGTNIDFSQGIRFPNGCFVDVDANTANMTISYSHEF